MLKQSIIDQIPSVSTKLRNGYSKKSLAQLRNLEINDQAPFRQNISGITIDDVESKDLDDGIWAEKKKDGGFTVFVSIADVAEVVKPYSSLDIEALKRCTSAYLQTHIVHMFPKEISTGICSLNGGENTLTMTAQIDLDSNCNIQNTNIFESNFYNQHRFNYEDFGEHFLDRNKNHHEQLHLLYEIAKKLRLVGIGNGLMNGFDESDRSIGKNEQVSGKHLASFLIQQIMILTNVEIAKYMVKKDIKGVFRNHMPEYEGITSFGNIEFERAFYSEKALYHLGLGLKNYCHFTSPIRRYADLIIHRQLKESIRGENGVYEQEDVILLTEHINLQITAILIAQKEHNNNSHITKSIRKKKNGNTNNTLKGRDIIPQLKSILLKGLKTPKIIMKELINIFEEKEGLVDDWIIETFLLSGEIEIIKLIKDNVLKDGSTKRYINIFGNIDGLDIDYDVDNISIIVNYKGEVISYNSGSIPVGRKTNNDIMYNLRKKCIEDVFDFFIYENN